MCEFIAFASILCFMYFFIFLLYFSLGNAVLKFHTHFYFVCCIFAIVIASLFLCSLMVFDSQEIKGLLSYLHAPNNSILAAMLMYKYAT